MTATNHTDPSLMATLYFERWHTILENVKQCYLSASTHEPNADFHRDVIEPIMSNDDSEVVDPIEIVRALLHPQDRTMSAFDIERIPLGPVLVAATYCW